MPAIRSAGKIPAVEPATAAPKASAHPFALALGLICLAVFCSGAGSLIYQVVWIRKVTGVTSATATAAALVIGAFMAGLALGARIAGRHPRLLQRSLLGFALVELGAALIALLSITVIDRSIYILNLPFLQQLDLPLIWIPYAVVVLFLVIPTTLLGMSLPLLIAHEELRATNSRYFLNLIYGTNTLGAVFGCALAGFFTIEFLGLRGSIWLGAAFTLLAVLAVVPVIFQHTAKRPPPTISPPIRVGRLFMIAAFLCGWVALAAEIIWTRLISLVVHNTVYAYTQVLVAVLIGIAAGGYLGLLFCRWAGAATSRVRLLGLSVGIIVAGTLLISAVPHLLAGLPLVTEHLPELARGNSLRAVLTLCLLLSPPTAAIAFILPVLALLATDQQRFQSFGDLYAINTWGAVAGSLMAGLLLLPWLGLGQSMLVLGLGGILAAAVLCAAHPRPLLPGLTVAAGLTGVLLLSANSNLPQNIYELQIGQESTLLDFRETALSDALITAEPDGERRLWINSSWVAATGGGHLSLGHLPAMLVPDNARAVGIGFGTGQTFSAIMELGVSHLDAVEINRGVIELAEIWFAEANDGLTRKTGVHVHHDDGRAFLRTTRAEYDLVVLEPLQAWSVGTTQLYTLEFYREAARRMKDGAILAQWIPFYGQDEAATRSMVATALEVFPNASLWLDYRDGILILKKGSTRPSWTGIAEQFADYVERQGPMGRFDADHDLLAMYQAGPEGLRGWVGDARILSDDRPFLEFSAARNLGVDDFQAILESLQPWIEDPADYLLTAPQDEGTRNRAHIIRAAVTAADLQEGLPRYARAMPVLEQALREVPVSGPLRLRYRIAIRSVLPMLRSAEEVEQLLLRAIDADPDFAEAMQVLAMRYARAGRMREAREMDARAMANPRISQSVLQ